MSERIDFYRCIAPCYDADYEALGYSHDIAFYVEMAKQAGGPVLEMGCGTGRVLLPTARAGVAITGMDVSPDMLAQLRGKLDREPKEVRNGVNLVEGDIRHSDAGGRFALVTAPFRVVQSLLTREDHKAWLANVRRHLQPEGALCFDVFQPDFRRLIEPQGPMAELERVDPATGARTQRIARMTPHNELQTVDVAFEWVSDDGSSQSSGITMRWFVRGELENLLELAGFRITEYWGSFRREPFGEGANDQVILARRS